MFADAQGPLMSTSWDTRRVPEADVTMIKSTQQADASEPANKSYLDMRLLYCSLASSLSIPLPCSSSSPTVKNRKAYS